MIRRRMSNSEVTGKATPRLGQWRCPTRGVRVQLLSIVISLVIGSLAQRCWAHGPGVLIGSAGGQAVTGLYDPNLGQEVWGPRVFGGDYQEDPADPFFTDMPGYYGLEDSNLPVGSVVGFNILDDLLYWDGTGPVVFGSVPAGETLTISFVTSNATAGTGTGFVPGYPLVIVPDDGVWHVHLNYSLNGGVGDPTDGIYLLKLELTDSQLTNSKPFWIVFDNGLVDCDHDAAIAYAQSALSHEQSPADLDGDGFVDSADLALLNSCWTGPGIPVTDPCCLVADIDHDGDVDQDDFGVFQRCYSGSSHPASPNCAD